MAWDCQCQRNGARSHVRTPFASHTFLFLDWSVHMRGTIKTIKSDRGFAFISGEDRVDHFLHRNTNPDLFDEMNIGDQVIFTSTPTPRGGRALTVTRA
jgi:cold shock CspA family protein